MRYYFYITLSEPVPTQRNKKGCDWAVCRADSEEDAVAQLIPEMREKAVLVERYYNMRAAYIAHDREKASLKVLDRATVE